MKKRHYYLPSTLPRTYSIYRMDVKIIQCRWGEKNASTYGAFLEELFNSQEVGISLYNYKSTSIFYRRQYEVKLVNMHQHKKKKKHF